MELVIGREPDCTLGVTQDHRISRRHAAVRPSPGGYLVVDHAVLGAGLQVYLVDLSVAFKRSHWIGADCTHDPDRHFEFFSLLQFAVFANHRVARQQDGLPCAITFPSILWIPVSAILLLSTPTFGEHGMPGMSTGPRTLPLQGRILVSSGNGVAGWMEPLYYGKSRLKAYRTHPGHKPPPKPHAILLKVVDSFDDMEGHKRPFAANLGYGGSLLVLAPTGALTPGIEYGLEVWSTSTTTKRPGWVRVHESFVASSSRDTRPPRWRRSIWLGRHVDFSGRAVRGEVQIEDSDLPLVLQASLQPMKRGKEIRLLSLFDPQFPRDAET